MQNKIQKLIKKAKKEGFKTREEVEIYVNHYLFKPSLEELNSDDYLLYT